MTNLLPIDAQKKIWSTHRARFISTLSLVSLVLSALAMLSLLPSYLALEIAAPPVADVSVAHSGNTQNNPTAIARTQALVVAVRPLLTSTTSPSAIIASALGSRPKGATVEHITYESGQSGQIIFDGTASRDVISAYRDALSKNPYFIGVSVPVGSLLGSDARFTLTLTGSF